MLWLRVAIVSLLFCVPQASPPPPPSHKQRLCQHEVLVPHILKLLYLHFLFVHDNQVFLGALGLGMVFWGCCRVSCHLLPHVWLSKLEGHHTWSGH